MPYCGSRDCEHCFPRNAEERRVLKDAIEQVEYETPGLYEPLSFHEDYYTPEFQAMQSAYEAGMKKALSILRDELRKYD